MIQAQLQARKIAGMVAVALLVISLSACRTTAVEPAAESVTVLGPRQAIEHFLAREKAAGIFKFRFSGELTVADGKMHGFRGVGAYRTCDALRITLIGPLGVTSLDYLNTGGQSIIEVDRISHDRDAGAREGLDHVLRTLTTALIERCQQPGEFELSPVDGVEVQGRTDGEGGIQTEWTFSREGARLYRQSLAGGDGIHTATLTYNGHGRLAPHWLPTTMHMEVTEPSVSVEFRITSWETAAAVKPGFFDIR